MALAAHNRTFVIILMTPLAIGMKSFREPRHATLVFKGVAIRAQQVFRGFVFKLLAVLVNVVTLIAFLDLGRLVVRFVVEHGRCPLGIVVYAVVHMSHVFL
jgi:hypothetical protein